MMLARHLAGLMCQKGQRVLHLHFVLNACVFCSGKLCRCLGGLLSVVAWLKNEATADIDVFFIIYRANS